MPKRLCVIVLLFSLNPTVEEDLCVCCFSASCSLTVTVETFGTKRFTCHYFLSKQIEGFP